MGDDDLEAALRPVCEAAGVIAAYVFGSRASGHARDGSDIDIAVLTGRETSLLEESRLAGELERAAKLPVDLVVLDRAGLELRGRVVQDGRRIYSSDEPARVAFETRTRTEYLDYLPTLRAHTRRYLRQLADR